MILVVFDIDGTLTGTKEIDDLCYLESLKECWQCDLGEVDWSTFQNVTDAGLAKEIFRSFFQKELDETELQRFKKIFYSRIFQASEKDPRHFQEVIGASEFIKELEKNNVGVSIATGGWRTTAAHKLKQINIDLNRFAYATSDDHFTRKYILLKSIERAKKRYGTDFSRIFYVGDGVWDYKVASLLKIGFIGIDHKQSGALIQVGAPSLFTNFLDKDPILKLIISKENVHQ